MTASAPQDRPYRSTPVFTEQTLPGALQNAHSTKEGVWGVIRVLEGKILYTLEASGSQAVLDPVHPGLVRPEEPHHVTLMGPVRMQVDFYDHAPVVSLSIEATTTLF